MTHTLAPNYGIIRAKQCKYGGKNLNLTKDHNWVWIQITGPQNYLPQQTLSLTGRGFFKYPDTVLKSHNWNGMLTKNSKYKHLNTCPYTRHLGTA